MWETVKFYAFQLHKFHCWVLCSESKRKKKLRRFFTNQIAFFLFLTIFFKYFLIHFTLTRTILIIFQYFLTQILLTFLFFQFFLWEFSFSIFTIFPEYFRETPTFYSLTTSLSTVLWCVLELKMPISAVITFFRLNKIFPFTKKSFFLHSAGDGNMVA